MARARNGGEPPIRYREVFSLVKVSRQLFSLPCRRSCARDTHLESAVLWVNVTSLGAAGCI